MSINNRIYLAGPEVFLPNAMEIGREKKALCEKYGFEGVFPIDTELDLKEMPPYKSGLLISETNENLIKSCDLVIANITPFRGPSADVGTVYEIGYARASGLTIFAYTNTSKLFTERTLNAVGLKNSPEDVVDNNNMSIENWGMVDNLMIDGGIYYSKGKIIAVDVPNNELYTCLKGFERCLQIIVEEFSKKKQKQESDTIFA